ncbi:hypothetical protein QP294_06145 [Aerococcus sanguinicola]|uniref:hypothetical protein n=1 Tax=Aerococcus sanguinicola TaxID=119206 RepID=UPI00254FA613|nr:hypothetical protein [Aerococcus sanguinicola]MDK7050489.1 hypothetical protein [Aerococcus sanguinicola]
MKNKSLSRALVYSGGAFLLMILAQVLATLMTNLISDEGLASLVNPLLDLLIFAGIFKAFQIKALKMGGQGIRSGAAVCVQVDGDPGCGPACDPGLGNGPGFRWASPNGRTLSL